MDINDVLNYTPLTTDAVDLNGRDRHSGEANSAKRPKLSDDVTDQHMLDVTADSVEAEVDETALKRLLLQFERKVLKNQELRIKFGDNPQKFMDSEMELFDGIQCIHVLSTQPQQYHIIVELNIIPTLLGLLSHDNTDISCAVVALLQELTDLDDIQELNDVSLLLDELLNGQVIALLVTNMERLDETVKAEAEGVYNSLAIIENLTDFKPNLSDCQSLIVWILKRFKAKLPFDGNKLYSSEILSILLQNNDENKKLFGETNGVDTLLRVIAYYKRHDPSIGDEQEYVENLFNCLCSSLLCCSSNRDLFFKGEGIELMNLILREKRKKGSNSCVKVGSLKVINHCLSSDKSNEEMIDMCCNKFVEILGLRVLMPILMKPKSIVSNKKELTSIDEVEEHCLSIIVALLTHCKTDLKRRVLAKFSELDFEKTDRLIEMHFKYSERLIKCDSLIKKERALKMINEETIDEDEFFMRRLTDGGLFTLQIVDHIILLICSLYDDMLESMATEKGEQNNSTSNKETIKSRVMKLINLHAISSVNHYKFIKTIMKNFANERDEHQKQLILKLVQEF
ncbi:beta-catenin-like protein 1 [Oppia nitens]|uniref:beta-catenin-like protein 1 n=1 Tax=Oppia nitens TaxID=1686743 RepID=UPI0023D9B201|nr:beta-catenin-like protein 1 [Oppia nitens]